MWLHYPNDPIASAIGEQYLWGRDILVAPVVEKGATSRKVYLPAGDWYDFWTNERTAGGREVTRAVDLATMPIYVRAGAIIPLGPIKQYVDEPVSEPVTMVVYPGANGAASLYDDDGKTFEYRTGAWTRIAMEWRDSTRTLSLRLAPGSRPSGRRTFAVRLAGSTATRAVTFDGKPIEVRL
jgi:alpha-glucosidase/alpha-D-xyloside xylohydrolase